MERTEPVDALELAVRAAELALDDAPGLRRGVQQVSMVNVLSPVGPAPATALARRCGLAPRRVEVGTIGGNTPQWFVGRAADAIAAGELDSVLVVGAEAQRSARRAVAGGGGPGATPAGDDAPDPVVGDTRPGAGPAELAARLVTPVQVYALFESVLARRAGRTQAEHRLALGELMAPFTEVAARHPCAWFPTARTPGELATPGPDNRIVAEPYPKRLCAVLGVDQGAAVLVTSLAAARAAGLADQAVFCWSGADAADVWFPSARPDPGSSPGMAAAAGAALAAAGIGPDDVGRFDLYSCFPCAVEMGAEALGLAWDDPRGLTVTGGLPYFGGPGNNYSLHAIATMAERLRREGGTGYVGALGWYATKHAAGVYGAGPAPRGWRRGDTAAAQRRIDASALAVVEEAEGPAVVAAGTVVHSRDGSVVAAPVLADLPDGRRVVATAAEGELGGLAGCDLVGRAVAVSGTPPRYHLAG
ncbi:MAG TPA: hypothetical protein VMB72_15765 [Acidimicrobiales bacterium]|nr:hypothetical protein [Acidimicrobiales bacterium]